MNKKGKKKARETSENPIAYRDVNAICAAANHAVPVIAG